MPFRVMSDCNNQILVENRDEDVVVDSLTSGRLDAMPGITAEQPAIPIEVQMKNQGKQQQQQQPKTKTHNGIRPHEVFVELHELDRSKMQWEEKARWIKYEQNAEGGTDRWGRPHIAHLSFRNLIELKKKLEKASLLLDVEERDPSEIVHRIVDDLAKTGQIPESSKSEVLKILLYEHRHVGEGILRGMSNRVRRNTLSRRSPRRLRSRSQGLSGIRGKQKQNLLGVPTQETGNGDSTDVAVHFSNGTSDDIRIPILNGISNGNGAANDANEIQREGTTNQLNDAELEDVTRRGIPSDAEATTIFIGQLNCLDKPVVSLVRLKESSPMSALTEVPIPVRFMFLFLGPVGGKLDYYELGRGFGTLMSSENFSEALYQTDNMKNIISAMNDFIDDTIVLPAGNWDRDLLLPVLRIQNEKVRERKLRQEIVMKWAKCPAKKGATPMQQSSGNKTDEIDPLKRTGIPFGGVINDIKRRYPHYLSDFTDALNGQCLAAVFFIFFAALSPAITFGGLIGEKTDNWMGISEMIVGTAVCGVIFALFSGQPLNIIGVTGPILVFEENLYKFCVSTDIEYLPFRFWVGAWMFLIAIICVAVEGSVLVRFFTRFTEDIFSFLISIIFIYEVFNKLYQIFLAHPLVETESYCNEALTDAYEVNISSYIAHMNGTILGPFTEGTVEITNITTTTNSPTTTTAFMLTPMFNESFGNGSDATVCGAKETSVSTQPNTALLSTLLMLGTFLLANAFKIFKTSHFLGKTVRKLTSDFGIPIAIVIMVGKDLLISHVYTQKLDVPNGLVPTDSCKRGWVVNPMGMAKSMHIMWIFAAAIPAVLAFILMFMESLITSLIVNKKDNKLKKGSGFHLDMFLLGGLAAFNGLFGLPWVWAATVRSVTHTGALSVYSKSLAPGEKPKLEMIREQRVTALLVNVLIGMSILLAPLLKQVPLAVLFGVFLYMGVSSLNGIQFADRVFMLLMPVKHHPDEKYVRGVRTWRMHLFTVIQLCCVAMLWVVKISPAALAFPFFLIILVPIRGQLKRIFSKEELEALDCEEAGNPDDDEDHD